MLPTLFSVFLDYKCNFWCDHCSVGSSPRTVLPMPAEVLDKLFDQLGAVGSAKVVAFTGGEATLSWPTLLTSIARVKQLGLTSRLVTNGWWGKSPAQARRVARELREAGLDEISTSFDDFHSPFVKLDEIAEVIIAALGEEMRVALGVIVDREAVWDADTVRTALQERLGMSAGELASKVRIVHDYATPAGTGETLDTSGLDGGDKLDSGCLEIMRTISIHPTGQVKACCGHAMFYEPDLTIGNLKEEDLDTILERSQRQSLYWLIHTIGPKRIMERLGVQGTYTSICHACQVMLRDHREEVVAYAAENMHDILLNDVLLSDATKRTAAKLIATEGTLWSRVGKVANRTV